MISTRELEDIVEHINNKFDALFKKTAELEAEIKALSTPTKEKSKK
jgi:hypothetical protein|tara:strand:+ start:288 stop:425 length:138 start_codon:yes stop_codon:yes gene_type:complete